MGMMEKKYNFGGNELYPSGHKLRFIENI